LGQDFGELIAEAWYRLWQTLAQPQAFTILEMGAGTGSFAHDALGFIQQTYPTFFAAIDYQIVEKSPILREKQQQQLKPFEQQITWVNLDDITESSLVGIAFSNELIDAFAVHRLKKQDGQLWELYVTKEDNQLGETLGPLSSDRLMNYFHELDINLLDAAYPDGYTTEVNLDMQPWLNNLQSKFSQGVILTIDYGYPAAKYYHPQRHQGTLTCYFDHRNHHNPYINLGQQDLTAHVDFTTLERHGHHLGLETLLLTPQALFLMALGLGDRLQQLSLGSMAMMELLTRRHALHQLLNPQGLGRFTVLMQSKNLTLDQKKQFDQLFADLQNPLL
jgi:SAM-dependent MidA family methyltransferase